MIDGKGNINIFQEKQLREATPYRNNGTPERRTYKIHKN